MQENQQLKPWRPNRPTSKGASAYHEAVSNADYYITILDELMKIAGQKISQCQNVVDFGAGTGVSAQRLLKQIGFDVNLWLVDNSPAWLGKAYEVFEHNPNVKCFLLEKREDGYANLAETIGKDAAHHVVSANTIHLVPDIDPVFKGIFDALKENGTFSFESGNITRSNRPDGALMVDDTVKRVHDIALDIVRADSRFASYKNNLNERIKENEQQRKFVFPDPRPIEFYLDSLKSAGFAYDIPHFKLFKVKYSNWLNFLRVKRLQAGILPEIGGHDPSPKEENDRDALITMASQKLFKELKEKNPLADGEGFTIEVVYVTSRKQGTFFELSGKIALVTGSSRGIGKAIAIEFARNGADVVVNYSKDESGAAKVVDEIKKIGRDSISIRADVGNFEETKKMIAIVKEKFGRLDILVNNAGIIKDKTLQNMDINEWNEVVKSNLNGIFNATRNAVDLIGKGGRVINISSIVGLYGNFGQSNYAASKAGIIGFTKSLAKELGKSNITVNAIAPGFIETDIVKSMPQAKKKDFLGMIPLNRLGLPEEVAHLAVFLASGKASYITGEVLCINGGLSF